jgi:hypothetical protein
MPKINWHGIGAVLTVSGAAIAQAPSVPQEWRTPLSVALTLVAAVLVDPSNIGLPFLFKELGQLVPGSKGTWAIGQIGDALAPTSGNSAVGVPPADPANIPPLANPNSP